MIVYTPGDQVRYKETGRCGIVYSSNMHGELRVRFTDQPDRAKQYGVEEIYTTEAQVEPVLCPSVHYLEVRLRALLHKMFGTPMDTQWLHGIAEMLYNDATIRGAEREETRWDNLA